MNDLILEAGYWGSNVPTLGVSRFKDFHIVVDDGDMGMPKSGGTFRVGIYRAYKDYDGENSLYDFEGDSFNLEVVTELIEQKVTAMKTIEKLINLLGNGFHPDSFIGDYVDRNDKPSFNDDECKTLQVELDFANRILGDDVYNVANEFFPT